jgi:hypothetical protein
LAKRFNIPILASTLYHPVVGGGGIGGSAVVSSSNTAAGGGDTYFPSTTGARLLTAHGGQRGWKGSGVGGKGGSGSTDDIHYPGGDGHPANTKTESQPPQHGGAGGSSAGTGRGGNDAHDYQAAPAPPGGGPGGEGGHLYDSNHYGQLPSRGPGGGGGGGAIASPDNNDTGQMLIWSGANGYDGKLRIAYGAGVPTPLLSLLAHMPHPEQPLAYSPVIPVGNGSDSPTGSIEYRPPDVGGLAARYDGTYTCYLIGSGTYGSSGSLRTVTVEFRQYDYPGAGYFLTQIARDFTPSTDILNGWIEMGTITLPINGLPAGNTDAYFGVTVTSGQTADRYLDVLLIDTAGTTVLYNKASPGFGSIWIDAPDRDHDLGQVLGSDGGRERARSVARYVQRWSGGAFVARPGGHNRGLIYSQQACPGGQLVYVPYWLVDRLQ